MKALIVSVVSGVMLFSASVSAADENRESIAAEIQAQMAEMSEQGMKAIKKSVASSLEEWAIEFFSASEVAKTENTTPEQDDQQTR